MVSYGASRTECEVCRAVPETVDLANGYRCAVHPSTYNPEYVRKLLRWGFPGLAAAHWRVHRDLVMQRTMTRREAS